MKIQSGAYRVHRIREFGGHQLEAPEHRLRKQPPVMVADLFVWIEHYDVSDDVWSDNSER